MQWRHWFEPYPELDHIQLEVTTFCNAGCSYCPRTTAGADWNNIHMTPETLLPLLSILPGVPYVHLQGWGEPLLNPRFFELVDLVKFQGCRCGTTTNGILLNLNTAEKLVASGIDLVAFSVTGAGPSHDNFRQGAPLSDVMEGIRRLAAAKRQSGTKTPFINVAYMLLRDGIDEIGNIPDLLRGHCVNEVVISTLDHVPHPSLAGQVISKGSPEWDASIASIKATKIRLAEDKTRLVFDADPVAESIGNCSEKIDRSLIIAADGGIHPCVFSNLPDFATGRKRKCFGNLKAEGLDKTWWSDEYRRFRSSFGNRQLDRLCSQCPKLSGLP